MIVQLIATNRPGSNTAKVAAHVAEIYAAKGSPLEIVDLHKLPPEIFAPSSYAEKPASFAPFQVALSKGGGGAVRPMEQFSTLVNYLRGVVYPVTVSIPAIHGHLDEAGRLKT